MSRPATPASGAYGLTSGNSESISRPAQLSSSRPVSYLDHGQGAPTTTSVLSQHEGMADDAQHAGLDRSSTLQRSNSQVSQPQSYIPSRGGTLKKKASLHKTGGLRRSGSRRSSYAGSVRSMKLGEKEKYSETDETNSAFYCPIPTTGNPTELLATRFQAWRKILKDLINYFRDLHKSYDTRAKALLSASNVIGNNTIPSNFLTSGGLGDAAHILREFHKQALNENNKARDLENEVIMQLTGLRSDLQQKIKEIKSLSGDFKNSVDKEQEGTKRAVRALQEALGMVDHDAAATSGKGDPFIVKLSVDRQIERQVEEENYLHTAYLNLEASGRELESIVVGEIQKAYNVLGGILRREADDAYDTAEKLKEGPLQMPKDYEWDTFVTNNSQMVDPRNPMRQVSHITYPGKDHPAAIEVRSGMLERKSKYLKNYTPGWYILSPTHLHEFKSADRIAYQSPIMSLYLPEQKLGSHSEPGSSSHKFMLKGRQSGSMHRGHSWVFRAETYDTMMAWFADLKELTETTGEARNAFVRRTHARSLSGNSLKAPSINSSEGGMEEDEADKVAFSGEQSVRGQSIAEGAAVGAGLGTGVSGVKDVEDARSEAGWRPQRPAPGGRFPSDINVTRGLQAPVSPSSGGSSDRGVLAAAGALPGSGVPFSNTFQKHTDLQPSGAEPAGPAPNFNPSTAYNEGHHANLFSGSSAPAPAEASSQYGEWMTPIAAGTGGLALGAGVSHHYSAHRQPEGQPIEAIDNSARQMDAASAIPPYGTSSAPIPVVAATSTSPTRPRGTTESTEAPTLKSGYGGTGSLSTDAGTISTVPTSTGHGAANETPSEDNVTHLGFRTATTAPADDFVKPSLQKVGTSKSVTTISDLHVPGEFPPTPALNEESNQI